MYFLYALALHHRHKNPKAIINQSISPPLVFLYYYFVIMHFVPLTNQGILQFLLLSSIS